jgi:large subunit ribosomal protein L30e
MVDANREIRRAVDTGSVAFGIKQCQKELAKSAGEVIIVASNLPDNEKETLKHKAKVASKKFYEYEGTGLTLGSICGKPFVVSAMIVLDKGKSNIEQLE